MFIVTEYAALSVTGHIISKYIVISLKIDFVTANSEDPKVD